MKTKKEKTDVKEQVKADTTLLEENKQLKCDIAALRESGMEMGKEIQSLRSSVGSYKSVNTRLKNNLEKAEAYANEADEMNEEKANRILELEKKLANMTKQHESAYSDYVKVRDINTVANKKITNLTQANKDLSDKICVLKVKIEWYNTLPWYRKIFVKTI